VEIGGLILTRDAYSVRNKSERKCAMKNQMLLLTICISSSFFIITLLISYSFNLLPFWDTMFACSLLLTLIGASMYILQSGFLQPHFRNFRYFFRKINRPEQMANQLERKDNDIPTTSIQLPLAVPFTVTGIILTITTSLVSFLLY